MINSHVDAIVGVEPGSNDSLPYSETPELIFGLVGPIGIDLDFVTTVLRHALTEMDYEVSTLRVTDLMKEIPLGLPLHAAGYIDSFQQRITYANAVRERLAGC